MATYAAITSIPRKTCNQFQRASASDYATETFQARREWCGIFKVLKSKDLQPRLLYPARLSFKVEGEIRSSPDKKKDTIDTEKSF